jgi:mannose-6-phosphate isomerase-like protein (cupin superfamily)
MDPARACQRALPGAARGTLWSCDMEPGVGMTQLQPAAAERFVSLRRQLGVTTFGINQIILRPGERGRIHRHERQEEVYLVIDGTLTVFLDGEPTDIPAGGLVRIAPEVRRQIANLGPGPTLIVALGGAVRHEGRDGVAFTDWQDATGAAPQEVPLPTDIPPDRLRGV